MSDASGTAFDAWWPRHAVKHNSRSPQAAKEAFDAGWEAARNAVREMAAELEATVPQSIVDGVVLTRVPFADLLDDDG